MARSSRVKTSTHRLTELLRAWAGGSAGARDQALPLVYKDLRRHAAARLRREPNRQAFEATELVHEAYLRLVEQNRIVWQNRAQFFGVAAEMMRRILVDRARAHRAVKRSGQWQRVTLSDAAAVAEARQVDVLDLDAALTSLAALDPRKSRVAELRFFAGLTLEETASVVDASVATVERDWQLARAWLLRRLKRPTKGV
jgi:RNA polymerase sigma factor (TIGR02999 family)